MRFDNGSTLVSLVLLCASGAAGAAELDVRISGFATDTGQARIVVMRGEAGYRGEQPLEREVVVPIEAREARWHADDLAPGDYALIAHHDGDADRTLDRPLFGLPLEPYGYSNGAWTSLGLPAWSAVRFTLGEEGAQQWIRLRTNAFVAAAQMLLVGVPALLLVVAGLAVVRYRHRWADESLP